MLSNTQNIKQFDREFIWHPYTSTTNPLPVYEVKRAEGCKLITAENGELIDGMSSWWAAIHGYNNAEINRAVVSQIDRMSHVMFGGITHEPAVQLARKLIEILPEGLNRIFYSDSGSVAVEVAMKMALQYWQSCRQNAKTRFVALRGAYHGDTWNAMSVCDPITGMHNLFADSLPKHIFAQRPVCKYNETWHDDYIADLRQIIVEQHSQIAALILEPVVQGAGGMYFYNPEYLKLARQLCDEYNILLIADEIATGFGRTGALFACNHANIVPDIMCIGKALTGGYITFAATISTTAVANTISQGEVGVFMHGPTFMANPLACSVSLASVSLLLNSDWLSNIKRIEAGLREGFQPATQFDNVAEVRVLGAIGVIEMKKSVDMAKIQKAFVDEGVWIRPFGKLVYTMPPYIITNDELSFLCNAIVNVVEKN